MNLPPLLETTSLSSSARPSDWPLASPLVMGIEHSWSRQSPYPNKAASISESSFSLPTKHLFLEKGSSSNPSVSARATLFRPSFPRIIPAALDIQFLQLLPLASSLNSWHFMRPSMASLRSLSMESWLRRLIISAGPVSKKSGIKFFFCAKNLISSMLRWLRKLE
ncbi:hypothetical protein PanWU01x14_245710, partial [Parasponia andersonii]